MSETLVKEPTVQKCVNQVHYQYGMVRKISLINEAGQIDDDDPELGGVEYMFDQNPNTCCHSDLAFEKEPKTIRIEFQVGCIFSFKNCTDYY